MKDFIVDPATKFDFMPHDFVPFKDKEVCERVRKMRNWRSVSPGGIRSSRLRL